MNGTGTEAYGTGDCVSELQDWSTTCPVADVNKIDSFTGIPDSIENLAL
jgi:hypothetical protein